MTKKEVQQRVLKNGKPLDLDKFEWDEKTNTFSSNENYLVLDFCNLSYCTFKTGSYCTFETDSDCTFDTGSYCTFKTGSDCTFKTGKECVLVRRDVYEIIELVADQKIKLNEYEIKGYKILDEIEEMTLEQICEKLGKKIKIIK